MAFVLLSVLFMVLGAIPSWTFGYDAGRDDAIREAEEHGACERIDDCVLWKGD